MLAVVTWKNNDPSVSLSHSTLFKMGSIHRCRVGGAALLPGRPPAALSGALVLPGQDFTTRGPGLQIPVLWVPETQHSTRGET